ncbi:MAG: SufS family cysteine desulfurase [Myxococcota bacterium]
MAFDIQTVRGDFPALSQAVNGHPLAYLDSASTTLKPQAVVDAVTSIYAEDCANVHRGVHTLSQRATARFEAARERAARFLGDVDPDEVIFTRGTTEAINLVAESFGRSAVGRGDAVVVSELEHHSNLVPWARLCEERGAELRVIPLLDDGSLDADKAPTLIDANTKILAVSHISNSLGTVNDVAQLARLAHAQGAKVVVDGAQAAPHLEIDVTALGADFYAFSGHKVYGPTGAGVLWGRRELLEAMPPWQGGGEMIASVSFESGIDYADIPHKFEAGTPDIAAVVGLGAALEFVEGLGLDAIARHEAALVEEAMGALGSLPGVQLVGTARHKAAVVSFVMDGVHPHDAGTILDGQGLAVRTGHHCSEPVMERFGLPATIRASFGVYNRAEEIARLVAGVGEIRRVLRKDR